MKFFKSKSCPNQYLSALLKLTIPVQEINSVFKPWVLGENNMAVYLHKLELVFQELDTFQCYMNFNLRNSV